MTSIHAMNLTFDPRVVPCESSERVHIGPDLLVHEVNVLSDDVIKGFAHNISRAQRPASPAAEGRPVEADVRRSGGPGSSGKI